jgi:hypothetical protein
MTANDAHREFARLFNEEKFFEAHEVLEDLWRKTAAPSRVYDQGLIQIAAALVHVQKRNTAGALQLLDKAKVNLVSCPPGYQGFAVPSLLENTKCCIDGAAPFPKIPLSEK